MTTDPRIAVLSALSSPGWHPIPEAHGMPWDEAEQLLAAYDASRTAVSAVAPATDRATLRERIAEALYAHDHPGHLVPLNETGMEPAYRESADAVLAVLPATADRVTVLKEAAGIAESLRQFERCTGPRRAAQTSENVGILRVAAELRRMADETQASEPIPPSPCCAHCNHPKRDHDGRADHRAKYSPLVAGDPWCHACNAECDYAEQPAVVAPPAKEA